LQSTTIYICLQQTTIDCSKMENSTRTIAVINNAKILIVENGQKLVPIKPICEALGVAPNKQIEKIKEDQILNSVATLGVSTGADGKQYEMFCLPFKFIFGWLFTINPANVKEEAKEAVLNYKLQCYEALYRTFTDAQEFLEAKQVSIDELMERRTIAKTNFRKAKEQLDREEKILRATLKMNINDWLANNRQLDIFEST